MKIIYKSNNKLIKIVILLIVYIIMVVAVLLGVMVSYKVDTDFDYVSGENLKHSLVDKSHYLFFGDNQHKMSVYNIQNKGMVFNGDMQGVINMASNEIENNKIVKNVNAWKGETITQQLVFLNNRYNKHISHRWTDFIVNSNDSSLHPMLAFSSLIYSANKKSIDLNYNRQMISDQLDIFAHTKDGIYQSTISNRSTIDTNDPQKPVIEGYLKINIPWDAISKTYQVTISSSLIDYPIILNIKVLNLVLPNSDINRHQQKQLNYDLDLWSFAQRPINWATNKEWNHDAWLNQKYLNNARAISEAPFANDISDPSKITSPWAIYNALLTPTIKMGQKKMMMPGYVTNLDNQGRLINTGVIDATLKSKNTVQYNFDHFLLFAQKSHKLGFNDFEIQLTDFFPKVFYRQVANDKYAIFTKNNVYDFSSILAIKKELDQLSLIVNGNRHYKFLKHHLYLTIDEPINQMYGWLKRFCTTIENDKNQNVGLIQIDFNSLWYSNCTESWLINVPLIAWGTDYFNAVGKPIESLVKINSLRDKAHTKTYTYNANISFLGSFVGSSLTENYLMIMQSLLLKTTGFLQWGYDFWSYNVKPNPFKTYNIENSATTPGDAYYIIPNFKNHFVQPIETIRLLKIKQGIQDYLKITKLCAMNFDDSTLLKQIKIPTHRFLVWNRHSPSQYKKISKLINSNNLNINIYQDYIKFNKWIDEKSMQISNSMLGENHERN